MLNLVMASTDPPSGGRLVNTWRGENGELCGSAFSQGSLRWIDWSGLGVFAFSKGSAAVRVWPQPNSSPQLCRESFSRQLQPVVLQALGWQALHASAIVGPSGVIAFCGNSGSGKSTLAFALGNEGWSQVADDGVVLRVASNDVMVYPLPFAPRLRVASQAYFEGISNASSQPRTMVMQVGELPLAMVILLLQDRDHSETNLTSVHRAQAFSRLLAHAHGFDEDDRTETRRLVVDYLSIADRVPVLELRYRPDLAILPNLVRKITDVVQEKCPAAGSPKE